MPKTEGMDLEDLTVMDLIWRTFMRITTEYMADVHQFLVTSLENLYSGPFPGGPWCVYQGTHHTDPPPTGGVKLPDTKYMT